MNRSHSTPIQRGRDVYIREANYHEMLLMVVKSGEPKGRRLGPVHAMRAVIAPERT